MYVYMYEILITSVHLVPNVNINMSYAQMQPSICDGESSQSTTAYNNVGADQDRSTVYANAGTSTDPRPSVPPRAPKYDLLIEPILPIPVNDFKHHISTCHLDNNKEFSKHYTVSSLYTVNVHIICMYIPY